MAQLLEAGKVDSATIRVENIIRCDITTELHEMLELYCELLLARAGLLDGPVCDPGLEEAVKSLIYAAPKTEIKELATVRQLLGEKYGKEFVLTAMENSDGKVNEKVVKKLSVTPPKPELVQGYLEEIARAYNVDWPKRERVSPPPEFMDDVVDDDNDDEPTGGQKILADGQPAEKVLKDSVPRPGAKESSSALAWEAERKLSRGEEDLDPPKGFAGPRSPVTVTPPRRTTENVHPKVTLGSVELKPNKKMEDANSKKGPEGSVPDISDLEKRFAALKKR